MNSRIVQQMAVLYVFTEIIRHSYTLKKKHYLLIIEEMRITVISTFILIYRYSPPLEKVTCNLSYVFPFNGSITVILI